MAEDPYHEHTTINRHFELDAGHRLSKHNFKCQNLHGHRYVYDISISGVPNPELGYVVDFSNVKGPIMDTFDHNFLFNEEDPVVDILEEGVLPHQKKTPYTMPAEPTVENIAVESFRLMWDSFSTMERRAIDEVRIHLYETPNCEVIRVFQSDLGKEDWRVTK